MHGKVGLRVEGKSNIDRDVKHRLTQSRCDPGIPETTAPG